MHIACIVHIGIKATSSVAAAVFGRKLIIHHSLYVFEHTIVTMASSVSPQTRMLCLVLDDLKKQEFRLEAPFNCTIVYNSRDPRGMFSAGTYRASCLEEMLAAVNSVPGSHGQWSVQSLLNIITIDGMTYNDAISCTFSSRPLPPRPRPTPVVITELPSAVTREVQDEELRRRFHELRRHAAAIQLDWEQGWDPHAHAMGAVESNESLALVLTPGTCLRVLHDIICVCYHNGSFVCAQRMLLLVMLEELTVEQQSLTTGQ